MDKSTGKVALVTGSSRGIGRSIALELAEAGYDVMLTARDAAVLQSVAEEIRALGRKAAIHAADLTASAAPAFLVEAAIREFGRLDVLINNAGNNKRGNFFGTDRPGLERLFRSEILCACEALSGGVAAAESGAGVDRVYRRCRRPRSG